MVSIGISIFGVQGQTVRYKVPLLDSPQGDYSMLEASCLVNIALGQENHFGTRNCHSSHATPRPPRWPLPASRLVSLRPSSPSTPQPTCKIF